MSRYPIDQESLQADFLNYVRQNTRSFPGVSTVPSSPGQTAFAKALVSQLQDLGLTDVALNPTNGFVTATIPTNRPHDVPAIGFIAHLDTADFNSEHVHPLVHPHYQGETITFANGSQLSVTEFPGLSHYIGQTLITTDGTTLLGADDKAGIAAAVAAARYLQAHPEIPHGEIKFAFGPDEEIGVGADRFDAKNFAMAFAYTLDNGDLGQLEYETFNAAEANLTIEGTSVHPGEAYGLLVNALTLAQQVDQALPRYERPEFTQDHEGFFLLLDLNGNSDRATMRYIIRDFDHDGFLARKAQLEKVVAILNHDGDRPRISLTMHDQYYNMADIIDRDPYPLTLAKQAITAVGLTPKVVPFRGGTDGSKITYQGIPTPNLFNGGMNFHGPYEVVSTEAMARLSETIIEIVQLNATRPV